MGLLSALALGLIVAAPGPKKEPKNPDPPAPSIVGKWAGQAMTAGGKPEPGFGAGSSFEFTGDGKFQFTLGGKQVPEGKYKIDAKPNPKELDFNIGGGDEFHKCIFKIEKDVLTVCWDDGGGPRPNAFGSPRATKIIEMTFKRVDKQKK